MTTATSTRAEQKETTRRKLLETSFDLFSRQGIVRTPTAEIAQAAGVAHGTVFVHFPTRDDLVSAVIEEFAVKAASRLRELAMAGDITLRSMLRAHVQSIAEQESFYAHLVTERPLLPRQAKSRLVILQSAVAYYFGEAFDRALRAQLVRPAPKALVFNTWLGLIHHYVCNRDLFAPGRSVLNERGEPLVDYFLTLIEP